MDLIRPKTNQPATYSRVLRTTRQGDPEDHIGQVKARDPDFKDDY